MATAVAPAAAAALLVLTVAISVARRASAAVGLYRWLAVPQVALLIAFAWAGGGALVWLDAALYLAVKFFWVPALLRRHLRGTDSEYGLRIAAAPALLYTGAAALALLCLRLGASIEPRQGVALGLCFAAMLLGFGMPIVRTELWCQAPGILAGEAGLATAVLLVAGDVPAAEALMLAEVVSLALVLGLVARLVRRLHGAPDARLLEGLRG